MTGSLLRCGFGRFPVAPTGRFKRRSDAEYYPNANNSISSKFWLFFLDLPQLCGTIDNGGLDVTIDCGGIVR